jgi:hypothetical protein
MWATCPRSASSGYHAEFHEGHGTVGEWHGRSWHVWINAARHGMCELTRHDMSAAWNLWINAAGHGMCELTRHGMGAAWHVWINAAWNVWINAARHGRRMACVNWRGTAWARHGMCELALSVHAKNWNRQFWMRMRSEPLDHSIRGFSYTWCKGIFKVFYPEHGDSGFLQHLSIYLLSTKLHGVAFQKIIILV